MHRSTRAQRPRPFVLHTLAAALLASSAQAEEPAPATELETITVSAAASEAAADPVAGYVAKRSKAGTKTDTPLLETPQSVSVITADQIRDQNAQTLSEVLRYSAGVTAEPYGVDNRGDYFTLRGGSSGSVVLDGLRQPLIGYWGNVRDEPYGFERVEVVRGPASVLYGQNAPGGLVNLVTKLPQAETQREISLQYGSDNHRQLGLDFTGPLNADGSQLYRLVLLGKDSGTQVDYADAERIYVAPSLTLLPDDRTTLTVYAQYQKDESGNTNAFLPWQGTLLPAPNGPISSSLFIGEPAWDSYGGERTRVGYSIERELNTAWTLRHHLRHDHAEGHMSTVYAAWYDGFQDASGNPDPNGEYLKRYWYAYAPTADVSNTDVQLEGKLQLGSTQHTVFVGVDALLAKTTNPETGGYISDLNVYHPVYGTAAEPALDFGVISPTRTTQIGISLQDQIKFSEQWVVVAGVRHDHSKTEEKSVPGNSSNDSAWTGRLGAVYLADNGIAPYAGYSQSFEPVAGTDSSGRLFVPKRGEQWEAGVKWIPDDQRIVLTAAVYTLKEKNRPTTDPTNPAEQIQKGEVTVNGLELEGSANVGSWEFIGNYTFTDASVNASSVPNDPGLDKQLEAIPKHTAALWAKNRFSLGGLSGFSAGAGARYLGKNWGDGEVISVPANTLLDALAAYDFRNWSVALNATNLLDKEYIATCLGRGDCWFGNRRKIVGTLSYRF